MASSSRRRKFHPASHSRGVGSGEDAVSEQAKPDFVDTMATAFLRRRLHNRRLRAAAVRGLKAISTSAGGRLQMDFDHDATPLAHVSPWLIAHAGEVQAAAAPPADLPPLPSLSIVVMVVGSRGDVQPFIPIARRLAARHRMHIATHREFRPMIEQADLEFYPLAGNPHQMIK